VSAAGREARLQRVRPVIGAVARQAVRDWGATRVALLDDGSPEAELTARLLAGFVAVERVAAADPLLEPLLHSAGARWTPSALRREALRVLVRLTPDSLAADPANKTALLLGGPLPPEPLLPLGDLYASEVAELGGGWSAPPEVLRLAELAGSVQRLDDALRELLDRRDPAALDGLPPEAREGVRAALARGAASRLSGRVVPKIGFRTLGVDLFE
jgi:hypothetical protein